MTAPKPEHAGAALSPRKARILAAAEARAAERERWIARNRYFHDEDLRYLRFLVPEGAAVLDVGCGTGRLLAGLKPSRGVGIDFSPGMIAIARSQHPECEFRVGDAENGACLASIEGPFDAIVLADTVGSLDDVQTSLGLLHPLCSRETRLIVVYYSQLWTPVLKLAEWLRLKMPQEPQNWLSSEDIENLLGLAGFECVYREWRQLVPCRLLGLGWLVNRTLATLPVLRRLALRNYVVARSLRQPPPECRSASVLVPCRNERGNVEPAVRRIPPFCDDIEILFVEGHSRDGTREEIERVITAHPEKDIKLIVQTGEGKGNAVHEGFAAARGDVLMILDGDLTVPPEDLPKFYEAIRSGKGEFANGSRLVYPLEKGAMRFLNVIGNQFFSLLFTWLLNQRFTDTLCGTKALLKRDYEKIAAGRAYFGDFDPFGDFDLIFGAVKRNLKVVEVPIRYQERQYGTTQISRFRHGLLLLRMVLFAFFKLKAL